MEAGLVIFIIFGLGIAAFCFFMAWKSFQKKKIDIEKYSAIYSGIFKHTEGLPLASGVQVELFYSKEKITFKKDQQDIVLECDRIIDMDTIFGKDVASKAATGAIAGKMIGGGLTGAAIGALATSTLYFVITYKKDGEMSYILLDTALSGSISQKITKDFKANNHREATTIEL